MMYHVYTAFCNKRVRILSLEHFTSDKQLYQSAELSLYIINVLIW